MVGIVVVTRAALLIARRASNWTVDEHLAGLSPGCVAVDLSSPAQVYCGTARDGLFRSRDSGRNWEPVGPGIDHPMITAVDVGHAGQADGFGILYAGTEPSALFRSDNGGDSWVDLAGLRALPSANTWSFPPRPHTHHVRWIEADVSVADRVFVAIEAGAFVRTVDGGRTWRDRVRGGPYDTHTALTHSLAPGRIYSAAGDGYFESMDAADSWSSPEDGLKHRYLVGVAVDLADPDTVIVSATDDPRIRLFAAAGRVVRLSEDWAQAMGAGNERPAGGEGHDGAGSLLMLANQVSSTLPITTDSSDQMMQDGAGRFWTSLAAPSKGDTALVAATETAP